MNTVRQRLGDWGMTRAGLGRIALLVGVYALAAIILSWPLAPRLTTHLAGLGVSDSAEVVRHIWWAREALSAGQFPFEQSLLVYPDGFTSWLQWSHPLQYLPGALLAFVVSPVTAFNLLLLITLVLNGCAAYVLGRRLTGGATWAALLGGLVFLAYPAMQGHLSVGHLGILTLWPLPLFAACWWGVLREDAGWRSVAWGALWFALTTLAYSSQVVYVLLPLVLVTGLAELWRRRHALTPRDPAWWRAGAMVALGGLLVVPFYAPLLTDEGRAELNAVSETGRITFSADGLAALSPSPFGWLADWGLVPGYARNVLGTNSAEGSGFLGLIALALAVIALWRRAAIRVWGVVALVALVLALGPLLKWRGALVDVRVEEVHSYVTLPWAAFQELPGLAATRTPGRFNLLAGLAVSVLVSVGAAELLSGLRRGSRPRWARLSGTALGQGAVALLLGAAILVEYQTFAPFPTENAALAPYFDELAARSDVRAVLDLPANHSLMAKLAMWQQIRHGHALIAGHALRRTPQDPAKLAILERAVISGDSGLPPISPHMARWLLSEAGADRVIVHKYALAAPDAALSHARDLLGAPEYEDDATAAFVVPRTEQPPSGADLVWAAGEGWTAPVRLERASSVFDAPYMGESASWYVYAPTAQAVTLRLDAAALGMSRRLGVWLDDRLAAAQWVGEAGRVTLVLWLEAGYHTLRFEALDGCDPVRFPLARPDGSVAPLGDPACLSIAIGAPEWAALSPAPETVNIPLDHGMTLRAYSKSITYAVQGGTSRRGVRLRLFWAAEHALPASYALFVHVADRNSDEPMAQYDDFPLVTTDQWREGAEWVSDVWIALDDLLPGEAAINVGWFDPASGARLGVRGEDRWAQAGMVHLGTVLIEGCDCSDHW